MNILHGVSGSIAATVLHKFQHAYQGHHVRLVTTASAQKIVKDFQWPPPSEMFGRAYMLSNQHNDEDEWSTYTEYNAVLHIELVKWADVLVIAPCTANTLAKVANGISDNLLTCIARAWDFSKPFVIAPAMNVRMWSHPCTVEHIEKIKRWGIKVVDPVKKQLYCGDTGIGALADISDIVNAMQI